MNSKLTQWLRNLKHPDILFRLSLIICLAVLFNESKAYPDHSRLFPQIVTLLGLIIVSLSLGRDFIFGPDKKANPPGPVEKTETTARFFKTVIVIILCFFLSLAAGILFVVPAAYIGYFAFFGKREMAGKILLITTAVMTAAYAILKLIFKIPVLNF